MSGARRDLLRTLRATRALVGGTLRQHRRLVFRGALATAALGGIEVLRPWPLKVAFDFVLVGGEGTGPWAAPAAWMGAHPRGGVALAGLAIVGLAGLQAALLHLQTVSLATVAQRTVLSLRVRVLRHVLALSPVVRREPSVGDLIVRLTQDASALRLLSSRSLLELAGSAVVLLCVAAAMLRMSPGLAVASLAWFPLFALLSARTASAVGASVARRRGQEGRTAARVQEVLLGMRAIQAFAREETEEDWYRDSSHRSLREAVRARRLEIGMSGATRALSGAGMAVLVLLGADRVLAGRMTPGDLIVLLAYGVALFGSMSRITRFAPRMADALAAADRLREVLDLQPEVRSRPGARKAPRFRGAVEFEDVTFGYEPGRAAVRGIRFAVDAGEKVAIVGATGSGKTTILNLLLRLVDPWTGTVRIDGRDIRDYELRSFRRRFRVSFQETLLVERSVRENILRARPKASREELEEAARESGVARFLEELPGGLETRIGERGVVLSGGQRRCLSVARAMLGSGSITVLDEPTSGLDPQSEARMAAAIRKMARRGTTFVVTHRFDTILDADRILLLENGVVTASGTHEQLLVSCGRYREMCDLQCRSPVLAGVSWNGRSAR